MSTHRGPNLPYSLVAGVTPWIHGWVVIGAKMHGSTVGLEPPRVYESFDAILGERPSFETVVVNAPIGYPDGAEVTPRTCDREARELLGRRGSAIHNPPTRSVLEGRVPWFAAGMDVVSATLLPRYKEVANEMSPFRQRVIYEGHPELSFYQLNRDHPLMRSKQIELGREERLSLLDGRFPGLEESLLSLHPSVPIKHLYDATALAWTARRVHGRAAKRIPIDPEWDSEGLRMEYVV